MVHQLCEVYGWSYKDAMSLTMKQIILMTHASSVSFKRMKNKMDADSGKTKGKITSDRIVVRGKTLDKLNSEELARYYAGGEGWGVINEM